MSTSAVTSSIVVVEAKVSPPSVESKNVFTFVPPNGVVSVSSLSVKAVNVG